MSAGIGIVHIIGTAVACAEGFNDPWREVADWVADQLGNRFGPAVQVRYFDLFDPDCPPLPANAKLPLVMVDGEVITMSGKVSIPAIRRRLEELGIQATRS